MHITITNEGDEVVGVLCVNRETQTCIVLQGDVEYLEDLVQIGAAMKAPQVLLFAPKESVDELLPFGWTPSDSLVVLVRERS
jgi:hypothetical protein